MSDFNSPQDLPLGLMMQLGQDLEAMNTFSNLSDSEKEQMIDYIKGATTGDDAKARIHQVINALDHHQSLY